MKWLYTLLIGAVVLFPSSVVFGQTPTAFAERDSLRALVDSALLYRPSGDVQTVTALTRLAWIEFDAHPSTSLEYARRAVEIAEHLTLKRELANALTAVAANYRLTDRYDSALRASVGAWKIFSELRDTNASSDALDNIGNIYQSRGEYARALDYYFQALALYEASRNDKGIALVSANIGVAYTLVGQFAAAHTYHDRALALRERFFDSTTVSGGDALAYSLYFMGNLHQAEHHFAEAIALYTRALHIFDKVHNRHGTALTLGELGRVQMVMRRYGEAQTTLLNAFLRFQDIGDKRSAARALNALAAADNALFHHHEAIENAAQALEIAQAIGALREERDAAEVLAHAHEALHETDAALRWYRRFMRLNDSLFSNDGAQRIAALQLQYATEQKNMEIRHIEEQKRTDEANARTMRNGLLLGIGGLLVALIAIVNRYRLKRRSEKELRQINAHIMRQQEKLEAQAHEIFHTNAELSEANNRLALQNLDLIALNEQKNEFLGIAAHDLRNPLANIMTVGSLLREDLTSYAAEMSPESVPLPPSALWGTRTIETSAAKMLHLVENLLDVNALERGAINLALEPVDIAQLTATSLERFRHAAHAKSITLQREIVPDDDGKKEALALADRGYTEQVLDNLVSNAIKYSPHGKRVLVSVKTGDGTVRVEIEDEGPGLNENDKTRLFGTFARLSALPTGGEQSTGLGLSIVKKLVEAMQGRVWCESEVDKGATFIVELPKA